MAAKNITEICNVCIDETPRDARLKGCSCCHTIKYCSKECQSRDWPVHKIFCNLKPTVDGDNSVQALLFPQNSQVPIFVRVNLDALGMGDVTQYIPGTLGADVKCYSSNQFPQFRDENMVGSGYRLHFDYSLFYSTSSISENDCMKHVLTKCTKIRYGCGEIARIVGEDFWKGILDKQRKWKGPLIALKADKNEDNCRSVVPIYRDFEMGDIKYLVQYLEVLSSIVAKHNQNTSSGIKFVEIDTSSDRLHI